MARRKTLTNSMVPLHCHRAPKPYAVPDPELSGHYVRVQPDWHEEKFVAVARDPNGKQVWFTLGAATLYTVAEARVKARDAIKAIKSGGNRDGGGPMVTFSG